ncbi:autotransporter outer membrane beta-barrel domain-containing protein [Rhizobium sp. BK379]|uniref:autotransporter domain-containing protein n=1 Tax=Rhizobium sp. BK379 TaxID=2587059 RepID=UPI00161E9F92|nr:autotransporter outer membrane beta-barrel domain-containing protein [Rhizobium sp. BK379]MBB3444563.1 outer membrane autotransporter protein [Rhizobium sp. BK379]
MLREQTTGELGFGFAASIEGGYPLDLGEGWQLEPQAQLVWQTVSFDDFNDGAADIRYDNLGRIGARLARIWEAEEATTGEPARLVTVWGKVNLWRELTAEAQTNISSASGNAPFTSDLDEMDRVRSRDNEASLKNHVALRQRQFQHDLRRRQSRLERQAGA